MGAKEIAGLVGWTATAAFWLVVGAIALLLAVEIIDNLKNKKR